MMCAASQLFGGIRAKAVTSWFVHRCRADVCNYIHGYTPAADLATLQLQS